MPQIPPIVQSIAASIVRALMPLAATWLIKSGLTESQVAEIAAGVTLLVSSAVWIVWKNVTAKKELNTALASEKPITLEEVKELIKSGQGAPAILKVGEVLIGGDAEANKRRD